MWLIFPSPAGPGSCSRAPGPRGGAPPLLSILRFSQIPPPQISAVCPPSPPPCGQSHGFALGSFRGKPLFWPNLKTGGFPGVPRAPRGGAGRGPGGAPAGFRGPQGIGAFLGTFFISSMLTK